MSSDTADAASITEAVSLESLGFTYPNGRQVLGIPQMRIETGKRVFLYGPSGSGKSTLLSLIAGVLRPTSGRLTVLGNSFDSLSAAARDRIRGASMGYIFQTFNLIPYLSVRQNIALPCELHRARLQRIRETTLAAEVERLAARLDIAAHLAEPVQRLSLGQQQRVAIARALIGSPPLLIADEPTSSLDANRRDEFIRLLNEMLDETRAQGNPATLLYVSHDLSLARHFNQELSLASLNHVEQQAHATA